MSAGNHHPERSAGNSPQGRGKTPSGNDIFLPEILRARLRAILPERAFLRRARSGAAYVTDALRGLDAQASPGISFGTDESSDRSPLDAEKIPPPEALSPTAALLSRLDADGFLWRKQSGLLFLSPGPRILTAFEEAHPDPPDFLCATLTRFRGRPPCVQALTLFADGIRLLERSAPGERHVYDREVRRLAALCLRQNLGGVYACALAAHFLNHLS